MLSLELRTKLSVSGKKGLTFMYNSWFNFKVYNISVICAYGGGNKFEQSKSFEAGAEIAIATPGRMIDMIKMKATNLERVTYLGRSWNNKAF